MKKYRLHFMASLILAGLAFYFLVLRGTPITHDSWTGSVESCGYIGIEPDESDGPTMLSSTHCGVIDSHGVLHVDKDLLKKISFEPSMPSCLLSQGRSFYVERTGRTSEVYFFDMGCDYFSEGLARSPSPVGTRFVDSSLQVVISTPYQFSQPFDGGVAVVCDALRHRKELFDEHDEFVGGRCGYIDRKGVLIVPMRYSIDEVDKHRPDV